MNASHKYLHKRSLKPIVFALALAMPSSGALAASMDDVVKTRADQNIDQQYGRDSVYGFSPESKPLSPERTSGPHWFSLFHKANASDANTSALHKGYVSQQQEGMSAGSGYTGSETASAQPNPDMALVGEAQGQWGSESVFVLPLAMEVVLEPVALNDDGTATQFDRGYYKDPDQSDIIVIMPDILAMEGDQSGSTEVAAGSASESSNSSMSSPQDSQSQNQGQMDNGLEQPKPSMGSQDQDSSAAAASDVQPIGGLPAQDAYPANDSGQDTATGMQLPEGNSNGLQQSQVLGSETRSVAAVSSDDVKTGYAAVPEEPKQQLSYAADARGPYQLEDEVKTGYAAVAEEQDEQLGHVADARVPYQFESVAAADRQLSSSEADGQSEYKDTGKSEYSR